jgi:hypothetical protein
MAIKLLVRRLLGKAKHPLSSQEVETLAEPVLRLLTTCLRDYGQIPSEAQGVTPYVMRSAPISPGPSCSTFFE